MAMQDIHSDLKSAADSISDLANLVEAVMGQTGEHARSLTGFSKQTMVTSVTYVEDTLIDNDITVPLMGSLNQLYLGYVLTALHIYTSIDGVQTVRTIIGRLANEGLEVTDSPELTSFITEQFGKANVSTEAYDNIKNLTVEDAVKHLVVGRLLEFEFNTVNTERGGDHNKVKTGSKTIVPIYVQMFPVIMPASTAEAVITLNFPPKLLRRWKMVKAGEIRFFRDFVLALDLIQDHKKAIKSDKGNVLGDFYRHKSKNQSRHLWGMINKRKHNNLASSTLIFSKDTFEKACDSAGLNFDSAIDRQRLFDESYAIMIVVVDPMYDMVDIYYNAISMHSEVPFKSIKKAGESKNGIDMAEMTKMISMGSAPKF